MKVHGWCWCGGRILEIHVALCTVQERARLGPRAQGSEMGSALRNDGQDLGPVSRAAVRPRDRDPAPRRPPWRNTLHTAIP